MQQEAERDHAAGESSQQLGGDDAGDAGGAEEVAGIWRDALEPREQARFISDLTARAAEICGDEGVPMVSYPYLQAQKA